MMFQLQMEVEGGASTVVSPRSHLACLLMEARNLILRHGWARGTFHSDAGYCADGALRQISGCNVLWMAALERLWQARPVRYAQHLVLHGGADDRVHYINDNLAGKEEALEWFDRAIAGC
jgi:hypothetical protein